MNQKLEIIGLMSGSSLDGLDVAYCEFQKNETGFWQGKIVEAQTFPFSPELEESLRNLPHSTAIEFVETDTEFIRFSAACVKTMIERVGNQPIAVSSHGHTIFHNPKAGYTTQIGNGGLLSGLCGIPVVSDFRTLDVGYGGQGAPLVPGAERFLFSDFDACLNLGGIANVSFPKQIPFLGFDISPCNQLLNQAANWKGFSYDEGGKMAAKGTLIPELLKELNRAEFYQKKEPKSLGNEEVALIWKPILENWNSQPENVLHTTGIHIAIQIAKSISTVKQNGSLLITGGGAYNSFLIEKLKSELSGNWAIKVPDSQMVSFKEAYCFAFLGLKRLLGEINCYGEVTGASSDLCIGAVYNGGLVSQILKS
jgi:anhydro-N-acetylmuramic acid kinase